MSIALLTDLYQLTMANGYWKNGMGDHESVFHLFYRKNPFNGGYAIACGLETALEYIRSFSFEKDDLAYLTTLTGNDGNPLFEEAFLEYLGELSPEISLKAVPEGSVVFPHEPLLQIRGHLILCQLMETALLNIINFQTLIATKASRICMMAREDPVLEFGLRRAQGIDGGLSASRAAYIGGCAATSNVLAGKRFGIPVRGTHAHSWVMAFPEELDSFRAYAAAMPNNCIFLVDTYDTLEGVQNAIRVGKELQASGHHMVGIRLDSGDLAKLSIKARKLLDAAGFSDAAIVASNDLDEYRIQKLKEAGAEIQIWGVGTRLATAFDQPALGGVYKLAAIREPGGEWQPRIKLSEDPIKVSQPGILQVKRLFQDGEMIADMMYDEREQPALSRYYSIDGRVSEVKPDTSADLLMPIISAGAINYNIPPITQSRNLAIHQLANLPEGVRRIREPHAYPVGLEEKLYQLKKELLERNT